MTTTPMPNRDHDDTAPDEHLSMTTILRCIAAFFAGMLTDNPQGMLTDNPHWERETRHLQACGQCADAVAEHAGKLMWDSPQWNLLEPGEFGRRAQEVWIARLLHDGRAPMREAAAHQLGALEPLSQRAFRVLVDIAVHDPDAEVRQAAENALRNALDSEALASLAQGTAHS